MKESSNIGCEDLSSLKDLIGFTMFTGKTSLKHSSELSLEEAKKQIMEGQVFPTSYPCYILFSQALMGISFKVLSKEDLVNF